jgi:hypothetical protein
VSSPLNLPQLAHLIIERSLERQDESAPLAEAIDSCFVRFAEQVSVMLGATGFRALIRRALHLTRVKHQHDPELVSALPATPDESWLVVATRASAQATRTCAEELMVALLDLLCSFIGQDLTIRLVRRTWTELDLEAQVSSHGKT